MNDDGVVSLLADELDQQLPGLLSPPDAATTAEGLVTGLRDAGFEVRPVGTTPIDDLDRAQGRNERLQNAAHALVAAVKRFRDGAPIRLRE